MSYGRLESPKFNVPVSGELQTASLTGHAVTVMIIWRAQKTCAKTIGLAIARWITLTVLRAMASPMVTYWPARRRLLMPQGISAQAPA